MARPSTYKPEYCEELRQLMAQGAKNCQLWSHFGVCEATFYNWLDTHEDFKSAYDVGLGDCEKVWEDKGLELMARGNNKAFNYWIAFMNRKFGWSNKNNVDTTNNTQINIGSINVLPKDKEGLLSFIENKLKELDVFPQLEQKASEKEETIIDAKFRESEE